MGLASRPDFVRFARLFITLPSIIRLRLLLLLLFLEVWGAACSWFWVKPILFMHFNIRIVCRPPLGDLCLQFLVCCPTTKWMQTLFHNHVHAPNTLYTSLPQSVRKRSVQYHAFAVLYGSTTTSPSIRLGSFSFIILTNWVARSLRIVLSSLCSTIEVA